MSHDPTPHFVRVARALALVAGLGAAGCGAVVAPGDGEVLADAAADRATDTVITPQPDVPVVPDTGPGPDSGPDAVADGSTCPSARPVYGTPCDSPGLRCDYPPECDGAMWCNPSSRTWTTLCAVGPLAPPELA